MNDRLKALADAGVSIWLDDLSRGRLTSGNLAGKIADDSVSGVTTNPTIFAAALTNGADYAEQLRSLGDEIDVDHAIKQLTSTDVRNACDLFAQVYSSSNGYDGRVSIEVAPTLANNTGETIAQASELYDLVDRPNVLIKIPATKAGLPAITATRMPVANDSPASSRCSLANDVCSIAQHAAANASTAASVCRKSCQVKVLP